MWSDSEELYEEDTRYQDQYHQKSLVSGTRSLLQKNFKSLTKYSCDICSYKTNIKSNFTRHYRKHTGERPFQCQFCFEAFSDLSHLRYHIKSHTKGNSYPCEFCSESFSSSLKLKIHKHSHFMENSSENLS